MVVYLDPLGKEQVPKTHSSMVPQKPERVYGLGFRV